MSVQSVHSSGRKLRVFATLTRILLAGSLILLFGPISPARADTTVCGPITVDTAWTPAGNNYIVTCLVQVMQDVTLTIEPAVRVYFDPGTGLRIDGELIAQGVTFGSTDPTPAPGDWGRIFFMTTSQDAVFDANGNYVSGSILKDSAIAYGGGGVDGALITYGASPYLSGNTVVFSASRGIFAQGRSSDKRVVLKDNFISDNNGGGIYVSAGQVVSNIIQGNTALEQGGGIRATDSEIVGNTVLDNTSDSHGGGIYAEGGNTVNNTVTGNTAYGRWSDGTYLNSYGGGIFAIGNALTSNSVNGNSVSSFNAFGGGIYATSSTLTGNTVNGNTATASAVPNVGTGFAGGAGIYATLSTVDQNVVMNNTATSGKSSYGGGIYAAGGTLTHNTIAGNTADSGSDHTAFGGGIYADGGAVMDNAVDNNTAAGGADSQGGGVYGSANTISNNSLSGNSARCGGAIYSEAGAVTNNTITNNTTSWTGSIYMNGGSATGNFLQGNSAVNGGGIYGYMATLTGNTAQDNTADVGAGILSTESTVRGNTVTDNVAQSDGGGIGADGGIVTGNTITGNTVPSSGHGSGAYLLGAVDFTYNSVLTNTASGGTAGGISIEGQPLVQFNNLYGNQPYDAEVISADPVTATYNYWGESLCTDIPWQIYDGNDLPGRGILSYAPSLYSPVPLAQLDAPTDLEIDIGEDGATLSWTPIAPIPDVGCRPPGFTEPDLVYHIWYSIGKPCGPYDGTGLPAGDSPIDAGEATSYLVNGSGPGDYYFVVTANDYLERESAFSNGVVWPGTGIFLPLIIRRS